ncbi:MAG: hypothetical protein KIT83_00925 [Bryobacterales bacterium]|nr:hypothetical protein [Bryobacterales bacterium]
MTSSPFHLAGAATPLFVQRTRMAVAGSAGIALLVLVFTCMLPAQPVRAMTEFARFTPAGELFPQDGIRQPVEVLSPPLVRGAWNAFRVVVDVEPGQQFRLYIGQNPNNAMRVRVLREVVEEHAEGWRIARRELVLLPFRSESLPAVERSPGRTTYTFWMEVQPPRNYPTRRLKLEPQVLVDNQWFVYPMEIRVLDLDIDIRGLPTRALTDVRNETPAAVPDAAHAKLLEEALCGDPGARYLDAAAVLQPSGRERESASVFARAMDALATQHSRDDVEQGIVGFLNISDRGAWCKQPSFPRDRLGTEWPAVLRNRLLQLAGDPYD